MQLVKRSSALMWSYSSFTALSRRAVLWWASYTFIITADTGNTAGHYSLRTARPETCRFSQGLSGSLRSLTVGDGQQRAVGGVQVAGSHVAPLSRPVDGTVVLDVEFL